jgi:hypothetical protein
MLRKMYLVSEDQLNKDQKPAKKVLASKRGPPPTRNKKQQHDYDKWLEMREKIREDEIKHNNQLKAIADFLRKVLPQSSEKVSIKSVQDNPGKRKLSFAPSSEDVYESLPSTSGFETPSKVEIQSDNDVDATEVSPEHVRTFGRENFGELASPYLTPYTYNNWFLDKQYGIRKEADGTLMIGNALRSVDNDSNITIYDRHYNGTKGLWELLTRKNVNKTSNCSRYANI